MIVYVFLIRRASDREPWPTVYTDETLARDCQDRVSAVHAMVIRTTLTAPASSHFVETCLTPSADTKPTVK